MNNKIILDVHEKPKTIIAWIFMSLQHVFAMFGATVLVPVLTGLPVSVTLIASGIGTLIYIFFTKARVPVFLGSSFAFIVAINSSKVELLDGSFDFSAPYMGLMIVGIIYIIVGLIIKRTGSGWLKKLLPPVVIGPMIMIIGLVLAPEAIKSAGLIGASNFRTPLVALITFSTVILISIYAKGLLKIIPFLVAIIVGYGSAAAFGLINFAEIFNEVSIVSLPEFNFVGTYKRSTGSVQKQKSRASKKTDRIISGGEGHLHGAAGPPIYHIVIVYIMFALVLKAHDCLGRGI